MSDEVQFHYETMWAQRGRVIAYLKTDIAKLEDRVSGFEQCSAAEWVLCGERLPEGDREVLWLTKDHGYLVGEMDKLGTPADDVFWMEIPGHV